MYKPKDSNRCFPKISLPIRLEELCLNAAVDVLAKTGERTKRNCRDKKSTREFLSKFLPVQMQLSILNRAVERLTGVQSTINILDILDPRQVLKECVDLLGPFRLGFGCFQKGGRLTWSMGSAKQFNMSVQQLDQLYNILIWAVPAQLKEIAVSIARDSSNLSRFHNILAQGRSLTKVTILSGADNHTLRILGIRCPNLTHLDVSYSVHVTVKGLRSLMLKRLYCKRQSTSPGAADSDLVSSSYQTNPCAKTLISITLSGTTVSWKGCDLVCKLMDSGYLCCLFPLVKINRITQKALLLQKDVSLRMPRADLESLINADLVSKIVSSAEMVLLEEDLAKTVFDCYKPIQSQCNGRGRSLGAGEDQSLIFFRQRDSYRLTMFLKMDSTMITTLVVPWYDPTWIVDDIIDLDVLGTCFPNLHYFRGRVKGIWNGLLGVRFLPNLQVAYVWSLNGSTGLSILKNVSSLKIFEFNNIDYIDLLDPTMDLNDWSLELSLDKNIALTETLEEITLRPTHLTSKSLRTLTSKCPNIKRIGDLESWKISIPEIEEFNRHLDSVGSQCILRVMNFPPTSRENYEFI